MRTMLYHLRYCRRIDHVCKEGGSADRLRLPVFLAQWPGAPLTHILRCARVSIIETDARLPGYITLQREWLLKRVMAD